MKIDLKTFFETPVKSQGFFPAAAASLLLAFSAAFWFGTLQTVDPVHHTVSRYNGAFYNIIAIFFPLAAILLFLFRKNKMRVTPAGLICAAGAAFTAFLPTFTSLALYLVLFSSAIWLCFGSECKNFSDSKFFITVPAVLFVYTLVCGIEYQLSAYNKLIFLYSDWGIYFSGYKQLADAPFESFTQWLSIGNHFNVSVNLIMALAVKLLPKAQTLFVVNSLLLASLIPLVYWFGRTLKMPAVLCALCSAAIAFNPMFSNQHTTLFYGYHPIVFLAPSFILFCIAKEKRCLGGMILAGIFMCGIKETVFVFAAGSAFLIPSCKNRWLFSVAILGITAAIFLLLTHIILPNCDNSGHYFQLFQYNSLGKNSVEVLLSPFVSPAAFWGKLFRPGNFSFLLLLLLPFLPAAWKAPRFLLAALPVMLGIMLKDCYIDRHNIVQQYGTEISVWFTAAMIYGTSSAFNRNHLTAGFAAALLTGSMAGYYFVGRTPIGGTYSAAAVRHSPDIRIMREHIKKIIPSAASVALSQKWGAQLVESHKNLILQFDDANADYVILDFSDSSADMKAMMAIRDKFVIERKAHPVSFMNLRRCQVVIFKKGAGSWRLPFIISTTPEKMIPHGAFLPLAEPGIRAKAMLAGKKLFIFTAVDENFNKDAALKITAFEQGKMNSWNLRWGYGRFPAYMMKKDHSFVIELPLPSHWKSIDDLNIEVKTFLRK